MQKKGMSTGLDFSGSVVKTSSNGQWKLGDRVCGFAPGGLGVYLVGGGESLFFPLPSLYVLQVGR